MMDEKMPPFNPTWIDNGQTAERGGDMGKVLLPMMCRFCPGEPDYHAVEVWKWWVQVPKWLFDGILNLKIWLRRS